MRPRAEPGGRANGLRSAPGTGVVSARGKHRLRFYVGNWFCFKTTSLAHSQIAAPQTMVSFHKSSQTRRQLWKGEYKAVFVTLLPKMLERHARSLNGRSLRNSALHFTILCVFTKCGVSSFKLIALYSEAYVNPVQTKK